MPLNKDPQKGGIEKDGSISNKYCSYCYQQGQFTSPEVDTPQKMQFCIEKMQEQGMPKFVACLFTRSIPKLERWAE